MIELEKHPRGVVLAVRARAGARKNGVLGEREGALRIAVTAAPEKGKANRAIVDVLCKTFRVSKADVELISGETSPQKRFLIAGVNQATVERALSAINVL